MLVFRHFDGTTQWIGARDLVISIDEGELIADNGSATLSLPLAGLTSFYFAATSDVSRILAASDTSSSVRAYSIDGRPMGEFTSLEACRSALEPGVYVIKNSVSTIKIAVK